MRVVVVSLVLGVVGIPSLAAAQRWSDATANCVGTTGEWTNKVELADVDGDGHVDILLANGRGYSTKQTPAEPSRIWKNLANWSDAAATHCMEITSTALPGFSGWSRTIKAADIDGDGDLDLFTGGAWQTQAMLFRRDAAGWTDVTAAQLPQQLTSIGDAEFGDVDDDGDLDIVIAEWGAGNAATNSGGRTRLYRNNGQGSFTDETAIDMPDVLVRWSWDIELADVDTDFDLDILVSCKSCTGSFLFRNDGTGHFTNEVSALPQYGNNYEFEPMDIDGDGDLDLLTINDGPNVTEHVFVNDGTGKYADETSTRLTGTANPANADDNTMVWLDVDNDGDSDVLIGTLATTADPVGRDRLLLNDGSGHFTLAAGATPDDTPATLGLGIADLDEDGRLDLVQGQGESAFPDKVQLGGAMVGFDTQPPVVVLSKDPKRNIVRARIHDRVAPSHPHDYTKVVLKVAGTEYPMTWYGPMMWSAALPLEPPVPLVYEVCATDRAGNTGCTAYNSAATDAGVGGDAGDVHPPGGDGGCCDSSGGGSSAVLSLGVLVLISARTRRRRRCC